VVIIGPVSLRRWLGLSDETEAEPSIAGLDEIERALSDLEPERARFVACFAHILGRVARADHRVTAEESAEMERLISARVGLPAPQAALVVSIATAQGIRHGGTEDFLVTREFARLASREERLALLDCLFALSAADRSIVMLEDNEIRRIASELKLEHADFITARAAYLQHLKVLGRPPEP
jgi:uncharacterized tellurite resistance protein B-like protein